MTAVLGLDVGGTSLKLGLVDADGTVLARARLPYGGFADYDALLAGVTDAASQVQAEAGWEAVALGVATPGYARPEDGALVDGTANVPLLRGRCFGPDLGRRLGLPAATLNDGTAATLGEWYHGAGRGLDRFAVLTFGTGVGGGIVADGRVLLGDGGIPPELGAIVLHDGPPGTPRTLEEFCCASGLARAYAGGW